MMIRVDSVVDFLEELKRDNNNRSVVGPMRIHLMLSPAMTPVIQAFYFSVQGVVDAYGHPVGSLVPVVLEVGMDANQPITYPRRGEIYQKIWDFASSIGMEVRKGRLSHV